MCTTWRDGKTCLQHGNMERHVYNMGTWKHGILNMERHVYNIETWSSKRGKTCLQHGSMEKTWNCNEVTKIQSYRKRKYSTVYMK